MLGLPARLPHGWSQVDNQTVFHLGNGGLFIVTVDDRYWLQPLLLDRGYEPDLDHFLRRTLTSRDVFLDCGANLGIWSVAAARVIQDPNRVVAVEAGSYTFSRLIVNWEANHRSFTALHGALSDVTGDEVSFFASAADHASATLVEGLSPGDAKTEVVTTISLLDLARERAPSDEADALAFVKLDVEGMEPRVLATIDPDAHGEFVILYEDHGRKSSHLTEFLLGRGFCVAFLADDGVIEQIRLNTLHRLKELKINPARGYNLLAIAAQGVAASRLGVFIRN